MIEKANLDSFYWTSLKDKTALAGITLDDKISPEDFRTYGDRLAERQLNMFRRFGKTALEQSSVVDVGCGMGRISLPFSRVFKTVTGVDINPRILEAGRHFTEGATNITFIENDGKVLPFPDASVDYVYSGGVLQHIKDLSVILGYFHEGLRILKPGGLMNYSIQTWMDDKHKGAHVGKKVTATDIENVLSAHDAELVAIVEDTRDTLPHMNLLILKHSNGPAVDRGVQVTRDKVVVENVRTGIWEDLASYQADFGARWAEPRRFVTFWGDEKPATTIAASSAAPGPTGQKKSEAAAPRSLLSRIWSRLTRP